MMKRIPAILISGFIVISACMHSHEKGSFGYDLAFLRKYDSVIVLKSGEASVIISPKYQGKVFTSTAEGEAGSSFGWINYKAFEGPTDAHMNAYGGENRLWLGPEGGKFSLFFGRDAKMEFASWKTPPAFDYEAWRVVKYSASSVQLQKQMQLTNYAGTHLSLLIKREIILLDKNGINNVLQIAVGDGVKAVGYETNNSIINTGSFSWTDTTGAPCLWALDMLRPSAKTTVIIPYKEVQGQSAATTNYFGEIPVDRIRYKNSILFFKADGRSRGKLGIHPAFAKNIAGSYDAESKLLTIVFFDVDSKAPYLNQEWRTDQPPFSGDAVNAYNDGPLADGKQMGPFYELESVSPAALLAPGATLSHRHSVFHFAGDENGLDAIAKKLLGVSLVEIQKVFD